MRQRRTGLSRRSRKWVGNSRRIRRIRAALVFRGAYDECAHNANEISALPAELVFRNIPRESVQGRRQTEQFGGGIGLGGSLLEAVRSAVIWVPTAPVGLSPLPPLRLALRVAAGSLPLAYSRVRPKPSPANRTRSLPGLCHGDLFIVTMDPGSGTQFTCPGSLLPRMGGSLLPRAEAA